MEMSHITLANSEKKSERGMDQAQPLIEVKGCIMEFPGVRALDNIEFTLYPGECHGLVGENGAGKSTLSKCIVGENRMTKGELYVQGEKIRIHSYSVRESQERKIAVVHQEFQLMNEMTAIENIFVGHYIAKAGFVNWKKLAEQAQKLMDFLQCHVNLNVPVKSLRTAERQIVQLAKALLNEPKVLILDELTSVLQEKDIQNIFRIIGILKGKGIGIIYISHRLNEIFECCDSYTVLCDGRHVGSGKVRDITKPQLIKMIIGRELVNSYPPINRTLGDIVLEVKSLTSAKSFRDINFNVRAGEVVGIAGLLGAGKTELLHAIYGHHKIVSGDVFIKGKKASIRSAKQAIHYGMGMVPDERRALGLNMLFDIKENTTLPSISRFRKWKLLLDHQRIAYAAFNINEKLSLKYYSLWQSVKNLSGGNQQKIVIAKWMLYNCDIFLLDEPTRGIDVGAKFEIYTLIHELAKAGKAVVLVSPELEELIGLCNRVYIMFEGQMMDMVEESRKTQDIIIDSLLGVKENE